MTVTTGPTLDGVRSAATLLRPPFANTPMFRSVQLCEWFRADVWIKCESVNPIASFKARGATTAIGRALASRRVPEIVTSSTGNHGQGVALASRLAGIACHVFVPADPNPVKLAMIRSLGATVHQIGHDLDAAKAEALSFAAGRDAMFVDDGESVDVMEGAGTVGLEIAEALERIDEVYLPMGSGTFAAGCATALKALHPGVRVVATQSAEAPAMAESFRRRSAVELPARSVADGLECRVPAGLALAAILSLLDEVVVVPDEELLAGVRALLEVQHLVAEPAGAAALAGAVARRATLPGRTVVVVVSGGNLTPALLARAMRAPSLLASQ